MTAPHRNAYRPVVMGRRGVVASAHPLASMAGIEIMQAGGNAVDAAVAIAAALNVCEPYMSGCGGVGVMTVTAGGTTHVLDYIGSAPAATDPSRVTEDELKGGPKSIAVPGNLGGWLAALERFGSMKRAAVFAPAIRLADDGAPITFKSAEFIESARANLQRSPEGVRIYLGNGGPRPGKVLVQKELAGTYRKIAEGGADAFYRGPIAQAIARTVTEGGGWLSEADLAAFQPQWRTPVAMPFRSFEIRGVPPPFSGWQTLQTINIMNGFDLGELGHNSAEYLHALIEAIKLASADRVAYAERPDVPIRGILSRAYAESQRKRIDPARAGVSEGERFSKQSLKDQILPGHPADFAREQTTHFACADSEGMVVSVTQTLGAPFGSGIVAGSTGIMLNNALAWTDLDPDSPASLSARRRGVTMMSPTQVFERGEFRMSIGTPGSFGILQTTAQMLLNALVFGMNVQEAIEAPRARIYRDRLVDIEGRVDATVRDGLTQRGHQLNVLADWSWVVGGGQGIMRDPESGALMAGADPRRDGYALAI